MPASRDKIPRIKICITQPVPSTRLLLAVTELTGQAERRLVAGEGLLVTAAGEERLAEVVQHPGFAGQVAGLAQQAESLLQPAYGLRVTPQPRVDIAETRQGVGFVSSLAGRAEQYQCPLQPPAGLRIAAPPYVDVAEAGQRTGFVGPGAELAEQRQGLLVVAGGLGVAGLPLIDVAERDQDVGLDGAVVRKPGPGCGQCLPELADRLRVAALAGIEFAEAGQHMGFPFPIADLPAQRQRLPLVTGGLPVAALLGLDQAKIAERAHLAGRVGDLAAQGQGLLLVTDGLQIPALPPVDDAKAAQDLGFGALVAGLASRPQRAGVHGGRLGKGSALFQMTGQGQGEPGGMAGPPAVGGVRDGRDEARPVRVQPGLGRRRIGHRRQGDGRRYRAGRSHETNRDRRRVKEVVKQPGQRRVAIVLGVMRQSQLARIGAQQVVHLSATPANGMQQVRADQLVEQRPA